MARKRRADEPTPDAPTMTGTVTADEAVTGDQAETPGTEDAAPVDAAAKFKAARELREKCVALLGEKRGNGDPLSDIAIASRLGVAPSYVAGVRAAHKAEPATPEPVQARETRTAAEVAHEDARDDFDAPPTAEGEETPEVEQAFDNAPRMRACPHCQAVCQRVGYYCTDCQRYVPLPDAVEDEPVAVPVAAEPAEKVARKPRVRKVETPEPTPVDPLAAADDVAVPVTPQVTTSPADVSPGAEVPLARQEIRGRDYMLAMLAGWENSSRRFPDLIVLADAVADLRRFVEARFDGATVSELERIDAAAMTRGLLLKLWGWTDDAMAHPPTRRLATFVRAMLQAEDHLQAEAK